MRRLLNIVMLCLMVAGAAYTFDIKGKAVDAKAELHRLQAEIEIEKETIELLKADWSLLTQPARLQELTERYSDILELQPIAVEQIVQVNEIPAKPIDLSPFQEGDPLGGYAGGSDVNIQ